MAQRTASPLLAWVWLAPAGLLAAGLAAPAESAVAFAVGLAAALSLSGSV
jgi:hypothetical protein